ncbi:hypothetical protein [Propionicimonas sp. T2.31MG-18]|uniref:hypothetical protein n=1 Tax=Propionicimonas sp. T2.31MG-18 TaxID=3157620 RepID=UPI00366EAAE2
MPTYACTPEAGGAEFSCSQQQYDEMVAKDKLYAEAEAVYRRFLQEDLRISRTGGTESATSVLLETTAEAFLKKALEGYRQDRAEGLSARGGDRVVRSIERLAGVSKGGSLVALRACVDASSVTVYKAGKYVGKGLVTRDDLYFKRIGSALKVIGADGSEVSSCG